MSRRLIHPIVCCFIQPDHLHQRRRRRVDGLDNVGRRQGRRRRDSGRVVGGDAAVEVAAQQADGQAEQEEVREDRPVLLGRVSDALSHFQRHLLVQLLHEINASHFKHSFNSSHLKIEVETKLIVLQQLRALLWSINAWNNLNGICNL